MTAAAANEVIKQAMALPKAQKRILLGRLWRVLSAGHLPPPTIEEIERRVKTVRAGTAKTFSLEETHQALDRAKRAFLKKRQKARPSQ